ncbi:MAG: plasmid stabilization protein [Lentisphaerae bacterium RIFOXYB12_FULL_65_16]|nr:MAG: plasmid stabilization protein [Lentisphaerae bacterium RIFOXYA12_64_32]OGV87733.1 MAG: plasmid stabilization protein [Lentisphaerae bacterium RIFOXYB12_FULL_65_16]
MSYPFHPEAEVEFLKAIDYYEACEEGLGHDFAVEVYSAVERAARYPKAWPRLDEEVRRCQTERFPYGILYAEAADGVFILAVMHLHRDPDYWRHRGSSTATAKHTPEG